MIAQGYPIRVEWTEGRGRMTGLVIGWDYGTYSEIPFPVVMGDQGGIHLLERTAWKPLHSD